MTRQYPVVSISSAMSVLDEGDDIVYTVSLDGPAEGTAGTTVAVDVADSSSVVTAADVTIHDVNVPMDISTATLTLTSVDDNLWDEHATVTATIKSGTTYSIVADATSAMRTVNDDDFPDSTAVLTVTPILVDEPAASPEGMRNGMSAVSVEVTITTDEEQAPREGAGSIQLSTTDGTAKAGSDYVALTASGGLISFDKGDFVPVTVGSSQFYRASETVTIPITHDNEEEDA